MLKQNLESLQQILQFIFIERKVKEGQAHITRKPFLGTRSTLLLYVASEPMVSPFVTLQHQ